MKTNQHAEATEWRDLTAVQFAKVERLEVIPSPWVGGDLGALLLRHVRECPKRNSRGR